MKIFCTRKIEFDAAHRVIGHEYKCKYIHGHRYVLEVTFSTEALDSLGMVIDFGVIKKLMKEWIEENFDHTLILHHSDAGLGDNISKHTGQKIFYLEKNPTAENIALYIKFDVIPLLFKNYDIAIEKVRLYETPNCYVEV